ncbi:hypothetical protein Nepgr_011492 [Nepenthes gracilis]|uniref:Homeobox domain-containing protein n=1 Tax=Nepenthes gracilis TaxID=150966 RepID=A0AAD3SF90_NEPGR|nr:hypothetical protein Nepgr_011492 [Nepenthes gracilis]
MEDQAQCPKTSSSGSLSHGSAVDQKSHALRSRWTPKPEQIFILESIFNSGTVNPSKDETVRIRRLLETFGTVGDANVFYWFQNRRSRSRRRQRKLQASLALEQLQPPPPPTTISAATRGDVAPLVCHHQSSSEQEDTVVTPPSFCPLDPCSAFFDDAGVTDLFSGQISMPEMEYSSASASFVCPSDTSNLDYQPAGMITVFINGVSTRVPGGAFDTKSIFGQGMVLVHSSGLPVLVNDFGISLQCLQPGESYYLVPRLLNRE